MFTIVSVDKEWVALKTRDRFLEMVPKTQPMAWIVRATATQLQQRHHWHIDSEGRIFNRESKAYVNLIKDAGFAVRGHGNNPEKGSAAKAEPTTSFEIQERDTEEIKKAQVQELHVVQSETQLEEDYLKRVQALPSSTEKRVVSYGLYGTNPKCETNSMRRSLE